MYNNYRPYRRRGGIRFFPHIVPIVFPIIFPFGFAIAWFVFHVIFPILTAILIIALILFVIRALTQGSAGSRWNLNSMRNMGNSWQQRQQTPYYQPPQQSPNQPYQAYGLPTQEQEYQQGYQPQQPVYSPPEQNSEYNQPRPEYPEQQMPPQ